MRPEVQGVGWVLVDRDEVLSLARKHCDTHYAHQCSLVWGMKLVTLLTLKFLHVPFRLLTVLILLQWLWGRLLHGVVSVWLGRVVLLSQWGTCQCLGGVVWVEEGVSMKGRCPLMGHLLGCICFKCIWYEVSVCFWSLRGAYEYT